MTLLKKGNILTAQKLYLDRIEVLRDELTSTIEEGMSLRGSESSEPTEEMIQILHRLELLEEEIDGIDECLSVLNSLYFGNI